MIEDILKLAQQWKKTADMLDAKRYGCNQRVAEAEVDTLRYCAKDLEDLFFRMKAIPKVLGCGLDELVS